MIFQSSFKDISYAKIVKSNFIMNPSNIIIGKEIRQNRERPGKKIKRKYFGNLGGSFSKAKRNLVSRMFWGRSNYYKNAFHLIVVSITLLVTLTGVINRFSQVNVRSNLALGNNIVGQDDLLHQGGSIETVLVQDSSVTNLDTSVYKVQNGDTLDSIGQKYNVTADTIRWANLDKVNPFTNTIEAGIELRIPTINGVYYTVRAGQSLDDVIRDASATNDEANRFNIVEFNQLNEPFTLAAGQKLFIPDGNLKSVDLGTVDIPVGVFIDPLSHPSCSAYTWSRGYTSYHNGIDLALWTGCPIKAVANGIVKYAGWKDQGEGYNVEIDHGGGIVTKYFHGNGTFWVKAGDRVSQGQDIMYMGNTGFSTGTHLHFSLWKDGRSLDPSPYVPYHY